MKISDLKRLFSGAIKIPSFKELISNQVLVYERLHYKRGSSIPIQLIEDDILFFGKNEFIFLCKAFISKQLNHREISYIADAILLSSSVQFEDTLIEDDLNFFCDFEDDDKLSIKEVIIIMEQVMGR